MSQATTDVRQSWSVQGFEKFWSNPARNVELVTGVLTDDIVGYWSGLDEPARGRDAYMRCIRSLHAALPDMRLSVAEHAVTGEFAFIRWIMHASGARGSFEIDGIDRVRTRNGLVCENFVVFDTAAFQSRSGMPVPWVPRH